MFIIGVASIFDFILFLFEMEFILRVAIEVFISMLLLFLCVHK